MNLMVEEVSTPVRILIANATKPAGEMLCVKALRGVLFGPNQLIDLKLLVYSNEMQKAEVLKEYLNGSGFPCNNSITVTCDLPKITDADVFIFITVFQSLNTMDWNTVESDENFDSIYLLLKIAQNLEMPPPGTPPVDDKVDDKPTNIRRPKKEEPKPFKPVIVAEGLLGLIILKTFSKNIPDDYFFCPSPFAAMAKSILGDHLRVECSNINRIFVWGANADVFYVDVASPVYKPNRNIEHRHCEWEVMCNKDYEELNLDFTQFNASWLKKELIGKIAGMLVQRPHGHIFKATRICKVVQGLSLTRFGQSEVHSTNMGVISDGSLGTIKGVPYFLPVVFVGDKLTINDYKKDDTYLKQEIKKINIEARENSRKLIAYCKTFLQRNIINQEHLATAESSLGFSVSSSSSTAD